MIKVTVPGLVQYSRHSGIGRVLYGIIDTLGESVVIEESEYIRSKIPLLRNFARGVNIPEGTDVILFPQLTGAGALNKRISTKSIVIVHDMGIYDSKEDRRALNWLTKMVIRRDVRHLRHATHIVTVSSFTRDRLLAIVPELSDRTSVSHLGVSAVFYEYRESKERSRSLLERLIGRSLTGPLLLYVGSEHRRKNFKFLLDVVKLLRERQHPDLVLLKVGGPGSPLNRRLTLEHMRSLDLGVGEEVCFFDHLEDSALAAAYRAANVYVSPSTYEGFGLPYVESLSVGTPVVSIKTGVLSEDMPGVHLAPPDREGFVTTINRLLKSNVSACEERLMREFVRKEFSWNKFASEVMATICTEGDMVDDYRNRRVLPNL